MTVIFEKYEVLQRLAVGGMGEIHLARQTGIAGFDRFVILKTLLPDLAEDERFVGQFLDEARIAAKLNHPNIVQIYDLGRSARHLLHRDGVHRGQNLRALLALQLKRIERECRRRTSARSWRRPRDGLDHAHTRRTRRAPAQDRPPRRQPAEHHRSRTDGTVKLVDFGIAKARRTKIAHTRPGVLKGKIRYMSPEQMRGEELDARTDLFALGIVLWEMLTMSRLFKESVEVGVLQAILDGIPPPSSKYPEIPPQLDAIVLRMLQVDKAARFASCGEVAEALRAHLRKHAPDLTRSNVAKVVEEMIERRSGADPDVAEGSRELPDPARARGGCARHGQHADGDRVAAEAPSSAGARGRHAGGAGGDRSLPPAPARPTAGAIRSAECRREGAAAGPEQGAAPRHHDPTGSDALRRRHPGRQLAAGPRARAQRGPSHPRREGRLSPGARDGLTRRQRRLPARAEAPKARRATIPTQRPPPAAPAKDGYLTLATEPWTQLFVDGAPHGSTPVYKLALEPGPHELWLVNEPEGIDSKRTIKIEPGAHLKLNLELKKR